MTMKSRPSPDPFISWSAFSIAEWQPEGVEDGFGSEYGVAESEY